MTVHIGTSGWQYKHWRDAFYPREVRQRDWLAYYAERFQVVEVNNTFYRLPKPATFASWNEETPQDFCFAAKMSRFLTHIKRLKDPEEPVERFFRTAKGLGEKTGPVLLQLPGTLQRDIERLDAALAAFPRSAPVAVEFRHPSWEAPEVEDVLRKHNAALCLADRNSRPVTPLWRTADWGYVRFHGGAAHGGQAYGRVALDTRARRVAERWGDDQDVYTFFNNEGGGWALHDARLFARAVSRHGLSHTRIPSARDIAAS